MSEDTNQKDAELAQALVDVMSGGVRVVEAEPDDEGVAFLSNGRIQLWWTNEDDEGQLQRVERFIRLPRFRQWTHFREVMESWDGHQDLSHSEQSEMVADWFADVGRQLMDSPLPEDWQDWPMWMLSGKLAGFVVRHWMTVPLVRGGSVVAQSAPKPTPINQKKNSQKKKAG